MIDRDWPHQIALPAYRCLGHNYVTIHLFCEAQGLSLCHRGHSFRRDDTDMLVFCFAERPHAEQFQARFGGEFIDALATTVQQVSREVLWGPNPTSAPRLLWRSRW
jgi:hypothetical protein